jgi:hypothetical protein
LFEPAERIDFAIGARDHPLVAARPPAPPQTK